MGPIPIQEFDLIRFLEEPHLYPIKRIVAATDMSPFASRAETRAALLAQELGSESLHLLHVIDNLALEALRYLDQPALDTEPRLMELSRSELAGIKHKLSEKYQIQMTTTALNVGRPHTEIVRYAQNMNAGLVVMAAHGAGFIRNLIIGSTVDKVLRKLTQPLLIVKEEPQIPYQRILVPVDFSESSRQGIEMAMSIAPHAKITALHAFEVPLESKLRFHQVSDEAIRAYRARVKAQKTRKMLQLISGFDAPGDSLSQLIELGSAPTVIREKAEILESDLIVIGRHGQSAWEDMMLGSVTRRVIQEATCDVLVINQERSETT
ncbi:MAG: universal stress protein [Nitrosospira sp.]